MIDPSCFRHTFHRLSNDKLECEQTVLRLGVVSETDAYLDGVEVRIVDTEPKCFDLTLPFPLMDEHASVSSPSYAFGINPRDHKYVRFLRKTPGSIKVFRSNGEEVSCATQNYVITVTASVSNFPIKDTRKFCVSIGDQGQLDCKEI